MAVVIVTEAEQDWIRNIPDVEILDPHEYLTSPDWNRRRNIKIYNLARSYRYQSLGYYVSLLAEARGHRPFPSVVTIQDLEQRQAIRLVPLELEGLINQCLTPLHSDKFSMSVYFGRNLATRYNRLARELSTMFQAPLLRFEFARRKKWRLMSAHAIGLEDIPASHQPFVAEQAQRHFSRGSTGKVKRAAYRFDLAILHNPNEGDNSPSDEKALQKFVKAAASVGINAELLTIEDAGRLLEFDALFLRETTAVNHYTYRLARRAEREGLVVIDDPKSILQCTNKVYLAELLHKAKIATPQTIVAYRGNAARIVAELGFPCVLKRPDSAFSQGVVKVETLEELTRQLEIYFADSELVVAQKYMRTDFDWRIGILDRRPLFACKYHMARGHWQIIKQDSHEKNGKYGKCETMPVELAPRKAVALAQKAADLIGDGLYGVDIKEADGQFFVIEVNDNPNLDSGVEDKFLRDDLYRRVMESFLRRIERVKSMDLTQ
ncbi:Alpha-aminoadipate--LysW ligase LysX [Rosistilla ulvae]|uniref:Alpha-aminoadipate--LysW ligase LysX n=1 Tax=Rosistilla ulvae TaxID=1930277 RepID=A0A517M7A4_9BACT|nr:RimK family protein [Rosistilla ulvae]QDS90761.1 Alpha-aminoadipate--LysW ligase LysX [Rosistilla ulvae]